MLYDCLFIDLDGPILETKYRHYWVLKKALEELDTDVNIDLNYFWNLKRDKTSLKSILSYNKTPDLDIESVTSSMNDYIESSFALSKDVLKPGVIEFLISSRKHFKKLYLVTMRRDKKNTIKQLDALGLIDYFNDIFLVNYRTDNPKYDALKNIDFDKAIFIGDTEIDFIAANKLGIKSIGIVNGIRNVEYMDCDFYYNELKDIDLTELLFTISSS